MARVALIQPNSGFLIDEAVMPPLGLWYIAAALKAKGHTVVLCDMGLGDGIPEDCDVYGITGTTPQAAEMDNLIQHIAYKAPSAQIIAGGPHATLNPREVLSYGCDTVVIGEGERILPKLIEKPLKGIVSAERIDDLSTVLWPDRSQAHRYHYEVSGRKATTMITSRGCPWSCAFCSKPLGKKTTFVPTQIVLGEVGLMKQLGYGAVMFFDDTIGADTERLKDICAGLWGRGMTWRCFLRGHQVTDSLAKMMKRSGCDEVGLGVESGSNTILHNIQKGETIEEIEHGISLLKGAGIRVKGFFIIGLPGESRDTLAETEQFLERVPLDDVDFVILSVFRGSPIHTHPDRYDVTWNGSAHYKGIPGRYDCTVRTKALSESDLLGARDYLEKRFKRFTNEDLERITK